MAALVSLFLAWILVDTSLLASQEQDLLQSLAPEDIFHYFNTNSTTLVPEFEVVWVSWFNNKSGGKHCTFQAQGKNFKLRSRNEPSLSCPFNPEIAINTTLSVINKRDKPSCEQLDVLAPDDARSFLSVCDGKLRGLLLSQSTKLHIHPLHHEHSAHLRNSVDTPPGEPHLLLPRPSPTRTHLQQSQRERPFHKGHSRLQRSFQGTDVTHLELLVVVGLDVHEVHKQDTERYILTNLNINRIILIRVVGGLVLISANSGRGLSTPWTARQAIAGKKLSCRQSNGVFFSKDNNGSFTCLSPQTASELLRDVTLGANIRVHLIRLIILTEPEPDIQISVDITSSLKSVCEWGHKVNPSSETDPLHADLLLYITRFDLALPSGNKQVRGVTQLGGVCSSQWNCVITEDTGFDLGITIAHEIGHSFGINHDGADNTCSGSGFIMASDGGYNSVDLTWSQCSRNQLLNFYSEGKAECTKDVPVLGGSLQEWKPGLYYGVDDQCRIAFGSTATACSFSNNDMATCRFLSCHIIPGDHSTCTRLLVPLLDGTECGLNQWCLKGRCVSAFKLSTSLLVHGSWSSWSEYTSCSRTCGGGITYRKRECNNPRPAFGGRDCEGERTEAELCNRQPCKSSQHDFMAQQCSDTDHQPLLLSGHLTTAHSWIPAVGFISGDAQCKLMCRSREQDFMVSRGAQFIDGTRCENDGPVSAGSVTACLNGKCKVFGCDGVLHSGKVKDVCGVCEGNGNTCHLFTGSYTGGETKEYTTFLILPTNASQVHITNWNPVFTHMAVLVNDEYVVAGHGDIALNTTHPSPLEENYIIYNLYLTSDLLPHTEDLILSGPITEKIQIQVYRKYGREYGDITSPNITYQYYIPDTEPIKMIIEGRWSTVISSCSVTCGSGIQRISQECVDMNTQEHLDEHLCSSVTPKPTNLQPCYLPDCPPSWVLGVFGPCSAPCGVGERVRSVTCMQKQGVDTVALPDYACSEMNKPAATETCNTQLCSARWQVSEPGECSAVCGPGEAQRSVSCVHSHQGADLEVDESLCVHPKPAAHVPCVVDVCPIGWESQGEEHKDHKGSPSVLFRSKIIPVYVWSPVIGHCTKTCGNGIQQIWFSCVDHQSHLDVPEFLCDRFTKPEPYIKLCVQPHCPPMWRYIQGVCSVSCGGGVARRVLYCSQQAEEGEGGVEVVVSNSACLPASRPLTVVPCNTEPCPARWQVGEQGPCSVSCDLGVALRRVSCVQFDGKLEREVDNKHCDEGKKPPLTVPCLTQACSFHWGVQEWSECSVSCGYGIQSRTVSCLGPSSPLPITPILCVHLPKPITIQACFSRNCATPEPSPTPTPGEEAENSTKRHALKILHEEKRTTSAPASGDIEKFSEVLPTLTVLRTTTTTLSTQPSQSSICGQLLLEDTGIIDLRNVTKRLCFISIGRPLDEVIQIKIESSSLNCRHKENLALYERKSLRQVCERMAGRTLTSRSNVLYVRQSRFTPGNGVLLSYQSKKNMKKSHQEDCDVQLFSVTGLIENPVKNSASSSSNIQSCRVFIDAPPELRIHIRALSVFNTSSPDTTYILIRDVDAVKTTVFKGLQLFHWSSTGSSAEVEFYGDYQRIKGTFRAEYSYIKPEEA